MPPLIIADAGPLIGLAKVGHLDLLKLLYQTVIIPPMVCAELKPESNYQGADELKSALDKDWLVVSERPSDDLLEPLKQILDPGEAEAIALAQQTEGALLIIDERRGRNVAAHRKIRIIGTGAVLLAAKHNQYIENIQKPLLDLVDAGYRLSPQLMKRLLVMPGED